MSVAFDHRDPGTAEEEWAAARPWAHATPLSLAAERLVVLSAHPDDETLGAGGLIATAAAAGIEVTVLVATDGEASHGEASDGEASDPQASHREAAHAQPSQPGGGGAELGVRRRRELVDALRELAPGIRPTFLGLPDGGLRESVAALRHALQHELGPRPRRVLLAAPWWGDGHRDHRIAGEAARAARRPGVRVVGYPIWLWHWGDPAGIRALVEPAAWRRLELAPSVVERKAAAVSRHVSQVSALSDSAGGEPIVHEGMAAHFARPFELFVDAGPVA